MILEIEVSMNELVDYVSEEAAEIIKAAANKNKANQLEKLLENNIGHPITPEEVNEYLVEYKKYICMGLGIKI